MHIVDVDTVTRSLAETADYYRTQLGLPVTVMDDAVEVAIGQTVLRFREDTTATGDQHLAFLIDDSRFEAARDFLSAGPGLLSDGQSTEFEAQPAWNARSLYFPGPDRSVLEVIARRDLPPCRGSAGAFGPDDLLSVSEVGIAVPDVGGVAESLSHVGIGRYPAGSASFSPAGQIDGMLILVSPGGTWFPTTDKVVGEHPVTVVARPGLAGPTVTLGRYHLAPGRVLEIQPDGVDGELRPPTDHNSPA